MMRNILAVATVAVLMAAPSFAGENEAKAKAVVDAACATLNASDGVKEPVKAYVTKSLAPFSTDAALIAQVVTQNAEKLTRKVIDERDAAWNEAEEELDIMATCMSNAGAKRLKEIVAANPAIVEVFVMDNQGANVCQNALTSDYYQGDEPKWQESFNKGKGGVSVGKLEFDKSANASIQQISLPIVAKDGTVIGAVCWGINTSKL